MQEETADPRYDNDVKVKSPPSWRLEQMRDKERAENQYAAANTYPAAGLSQGALGHAYENKCARPSLRERVNSSFYRAERESRNIDRLKELADLLDTNPAIARILELIEATGV